MKSLILLLLFVSVNISAQSQRAESVQKPKLVVGIIVDQMRQEYLYRFSSKFGEGGFKRLMNDGFYLKNAHYNYAPTVTGPGHASVYTGSTPAVHGIISNEWYDKILQKEVNCVNDSNQTPVGNPEGNGDVSPWRMLTTTITDELRLSTQKRSKVIGISFKDRGAVLPAGHMGNAAYWYDGRTGKFVTSTYYMRKLPDWVEKFNQLNMAEKFLSQEWKTSLPIDQYVESGPDDSPYESKMQGKDKPVFPYNLRELRAKNGNFELLSNTPFADDYITAMGKAALSGEQLGADEWTDFLALSFSTPDIIGHAMGPNSIEVEDTYIRLDKNIEDLLNTLDQQMGPGNYALFLTADHAVADVAQYLKDNKIPAGYFNPANVKASLNEYLQRYYPDKEIIEAIDGEQIFFNQQAFARDPKSSGVDMIVATELTTNFLLAQEGVANVFSESIIRQSRYDEGGVKGMVTRGYHPKRSGDLILVLEPGWYSSGRIQGTTHGSPYTYDTNVPIMFYGYGIKKGSSVRYHSITDIAPTLSVLLNIKFPNGCTGQPIEELFEK
jgi:predicted AlkP superfamily pyrophosphatase or phosphodiesterase